MKDLIGAKVRLKEKHAKWHLDHPDVYFSRNREEQERPLFELESQMHLMCCMGVPMLGVVVKQGNLGCYLVAFEVGGLRTDYYVDPKDFEVL